MAENPFETATELVGSLRAEYDQLNIGLPKLRETKKKLTGDLEELNKKVVDKQTELSDLEVKIEGQTNAYNTWQAGEFKKLEDSKTTFSIEKSEVHKKQAMKDTDLVARERAVETDRRNLNTSIQKVKDAQKVADDQHAANQKWATQLAEREQGLNDRETGINEREAKSDARTVNLEHREAKVVESEKAVKTATDDAERDRKSARTLLEDAKESIAKNDIRENGLNKRKGLLDNREGALNTRERALVDRTNIAIANGTLPH